MNTKTILVPLAVAATLYGCGGGGNGGGGSAPPELSSITESNATKSVAVAYSAGAALFDASATSAMLAKSAEAQPSERGTPGLVQFSIRQLRVLAEGGHQESAEPESPLATKAPANFQEQCENPGGTAHLVGDIQDQVDFFLSTGDHATITFSNCLLEGVIIDGRLVLSDIVVAQDTSVRFEFSNVNLSAGGDTANIDGAFRLSMPTNASDAAPIPVTLRDVSLRTTSRGQTIELSGVNADTMLDFVSGSFSYTMTGRIADSASGVSVSLTTTTPFSGIADVLTAGDLTIEGARASRARALVSAPNQLTISVDADGDGRFEKQLDPISVTTLLDS